MNEMIERIARALCAQAHNGNLSPDAIMTCGPAKEVGLPAWRMFEDRAFTALIAMREPTEAMRRAFYEELAGGDSDGMGCWNAMINAALAQPTRPKGLPYRPGSVLDL